MEKYNIENKKTVKDLILLGKIYIISAFAVAFVSFVFKVFDIDFLGKYIFTQDTVISPVSSLSYMFLAIALWLIRKENSNKKLRIISNCIVTLPFLLGLTRIIFSILDLTYILNQNYFGSLITAIVITLSSISIWLINYTTKDLYNFSQPLNYIVALIGLLSIYGYAYDFDDLQIHLTKIPFSIQSSICTIFLSTGTLFIRPHYGSMTTIIGHNTTQIVLLRFLSFFIPLFIGWFKLEGTKQQWFGKEFGTAIYASTTFAISMALLGWKSFIQSKLKKTRYQNKERIKKSRKFIKHILDLSPTTISILDVQTHKFIYVNKESRKNFNIKGSIIDNFKYEDLISNIVYKDDQEKAKKRFDELQKFEKGDSDHFMYRVTDKNDQINWILSDAAVFELNNNKPTKIILNGLNITKQKEIEEKLKAKTKEIEEKNKELEKINERLEEINQDLEKEVEIVIQNLKESERASKDFFENSFEGILRYSLKDIDGIDIDKPVEEQIKLISEHAYIAEANKEILHLHGYDNKDELVGMPVLEFLKMPEKDKIKIIQTFIKENYQLENFPTVHKKKNGDEVHLFLSISGIIENNKLTDAWATQISRKD